MDFLRILGDGIIRVGFLEASVLGVQMASFSGSSEGLLSVSSFVVLVRTPHNLILT